MGHAIAVCSLFDLSKLVHGQRLRVAHIPVHSMLGCVICTEITHFNWLHCTHSYTYSASAHIRLNHRIVCYVMSIGNYLHAYIALYFYYYALVLKYSLLKGVISRVLILDVLRHHD